ncbi:MAG: hypothetical protein U0441_16345 [Polyangiaceae bacterium]
MWERTAIGWMGVAVLAVWAGCGHDRFVPGRACAPGDSRPCYSGKPGTEGVGPCTGGTETCLPDASGWSACIGEVTPKPETCLTDVDDDCDHAVNEDGEGCACVPTQKEPCYEGDPDTAGVGACKPGQRTCGASGMYGACEGQVIPKAEDCDAPADEDCDGTACSAPIWGALFGDVRGATTAAQEARAVAVGPDGDVFVAFDFAGSIQIGSQSLTSAGGVDIAVARLTPEGAVTWVQQIGGDKDDTTAGLAVGEDDSPVLAATFFSSQLTVGTQILNDGNGADALVVKLGGVTGAPLWGRRIGQTGNIRAASIAVAPPEAPGQDGDVVIAGSFTGTLVCIGASCVVSDISSDTPEAYVQAFTGNGSAVRFTKTIGGPGQDGATSVAAGADGSIIVGGAVAEDARLDMLVLTPPGSTDPNAFLAKLSKDGEPLWAHAYGDTAAQSVLSVACSAAGDIVAGGSSQGAIDFGGGATIPVKPSQAFVVRFAGDGAPMWARGFAGSGLTYIASVALDADDHVLATGPFGGTVAFGGKAPLTAGQTDAFLLKLDAGGATLWAHGYGATDKLDRGDAVAATPESEVLFGGAFGGAVDFGLGPLQSAGQLDAGVALFQP